MQRISGELRMNEFNESASVGYTTQFAETDYAFADVMTCFPPAPAASSSSKSRVTGGDVFLILLFVGLFIYFAAGTAYNYRYVFGSGHTLFAFILLLLFCSHSLDVVGLV